MKTKPGNLFYAFFFISTIGLHAQGTELIVNGDFSGGNSGFTSDYTYCNSANCLLYEGFYAVGANPTFFHPNFFGTDHSTGTGNLMIINGNVKPNKNVWCETISVNPGTRYTFSYWLSSLVIDNPAVLQLKINGVAIGSTFSAPTSLYVWAQFSVTWNSGANTSADICLVDKNTIADGNDFGLDDISFKSISTINLADSLALVDLYNNTDGANWTNHENWLTPNPVSTWYGVTAGGRVIEIALGNNNLNGKIPYAIGHLRKLQRLELNNNQLSGRIPLNFGNLENLEYLYLDSNQLNGPIPSFLGNLTKLVELNLKHNKLRDSIPSSLGNCTNLRILRLAHNQLSGNIPSSFSNLTSLRILGVGFNNLSGTAPVFLTTLPKLRILGLVHNHYTFDGMEHLVQHPFDTLRYWMQKKIPVHQNGNSLSVYAGGTLSNNTYNWYRDGALAATINGDSTFTPTGSGAYNVEVTNSIATKLTLKSDTITFNALRVAQQNNIAGTSLNAVADYKLYPNPVRDVLHLDHLSGRATISILTQDGRVVDKKIVSGSSYAWNVKDLAAGSYYVKIEKDKTSTVLKFIKQ